jgi:hypothetical protein
LAQNALNFAVMNPDIINNGGPEKRKHCGGGRAFHSRLEPFVDFIRDQRQRRRTWQEIAAVLFSEKGCAITTQGVHQFYRRYLHRRAQAHWEEIPSVSKAITTQTGIATGTGAKTNFGCNSVIARSSPAKSRRYELNDPTNI